VEASTAIWDAIAQQVFMFGGNAVVGADSPVVVVDTWDGYDGERRAVLDALARAPKTWSLTGDFTPRRGRPAGRPLRSVAAGGRRVHGWSISSSFFDDDATVESL
jgi:hypothetical protein